MAGYAATFQNIQDAVIAKVRLDATVDLAAVKNWINHTYTQACLECEVLQQSGSFTLTANTATYDLSTITLTPTGTIARIKQLYPTPAGAAQSKPARLATMDEILSRRVSAGGVATPLGAAMIYAVAGLNDLEIYPTPSAADTLTLWYVKQPAALSSNSDLHVLGEPFSKLIEYGACAEAADFKGDPAVDDYRSLYESWIGRLRAHMLYRRGAQPGQFRQLDTAGYTPHDPASIRPWYA